MHKKMWALHNWVGLYAGVVIAVLSITGVVALFKVEIDKGLNPSLFKVQSQGKYANLSPVIDSLRTVHGAENLGYVGVSKTPEDSWNVLFFIRNSTIDIKQLQVFINPYTGKVLGERDVYKSANFFIRNIHVRLFESLFGRQIVGLAGIALLISTVTGFWIYGGFMKKQLFGIIRKKNLRIKMADYHKLIGIVTLVFNLMIAITGGWLGLQGLLQPALGIDRPGIYEVTEKPLDEDSDVAYKIDYNAVYDKSRELFPELMPAQIRPSIDGSRTVSVWGSVPRTAFERDRFSLTLDKKNLKELNRYDIRKAPIGEKLFYIQESMHFGDYGGVLLKIIYSFFGIISGFLALTGFVVYLKRTEKERIQKPKFIELKPLLLRWTIGILGAILLLLILHLSFGIAVPSILTIVVVYLSLIFLIIRAIILFIKKKIRTRKTAV